MKSYKIVGAVLASINSVNSFKYLGIMIAAVAVLFASAIPSYAWQPRTRLGQRIQARGGILSKIVSGRTSCGASFSTATCGSAVPVSCSGSMATPSCGTATVHFIGTAPTPIYMESTPTMDCIDGKCTPIRTVVGAVAQSAKGSLEFATRLAREGRMYHDRSYIGYENVASGASSPADAIRMWQNSPPHRRNLPYITDIQCVNGFCVGR